MAGSVSVAATGGKRKGALVQCCGVHIDALVCCSVHAPLPWVRVHPANGDEPLLHHVLKDLLVALCRAAVAGARLKWARASQRERRVQRRATHE